MSDNTEPSLISGHYEYAKGAAVEAIGKATGATTWIESGAHEREAGLTEMKEAGHRRDEDGEHGAGAAEKALGNAVGCEGMQREGEASEGK